jgi:Invasin, domain 3
VNFSATRGTLSAASVMTDANGNATVNISSTTAGPALIAASGTAVSAQQQISFVATTPSQIAIQASPDTIATQGNSTITAIVRDAQNNLVQGQTVNFTLNDITGGQLSFASVMTDSEGVAQTVYTASTKPSTSNGVTVTATVQGTAITASTTLTVGGQTVFISLGTGNTIAENASKTQFQMPWVVQAVDSAGNPVNNVTITLTIHSSSRPDWAYQKGTYLFCGSSWVQVNNGTAAGPAKCAALIAPVQCLNEDLNLTGVYEASEDTNNNGKLDPGDVAVATPGSLTTATDGSATFTVEYPEDHALWVQTTLTATATVQGTQSSTTAIFELPMLATYLTNQQVNPPGLVSPYGVAGVCTDPN